MQIKSKESFLEFLKFNIVGIINTAFTYGIYSLTVFITNNYTIAVCADYAIGICSSFILNKHFTFNNKDSMTFGMFLKMILSYIPSLILNLISLHVLIGLWNFNKYGAQLLTAACIAYISFIIQKFFVFTNNGKSRNIVINGDFLCRSPRTGIERFALETCINLDSLIVPGSISIIIPENACDIPVFKNITMVRVSRKCTFFPIWEHFFFSLYVKKLHGIPLDFSNMTPLFRPGIAFIHDIYAVSCPDDFTSFHDKLVRLYSLIMYRHTVRHSKLLITVSDFSRCQISDIYHIPSEKIHVIYNGWDHFKSVKPDNSIFTNLPNITKGTFYLTLGSLSKRKNLKWIASYAEKHTSDLFVISGKAISGLLPPELAHLTTFPNVLLPGYLSDEQIKALMENCRAFIFPSYYEGFGIPPLEALSCGAPVIVSNAACLPEIYGSCAHYIDPDNTDTDLNELLREPVVPPEKLLEKYTYKHSAEQLNILLKQYY